MVSQNSDYRKTVALCEKGNYQEAKPILKNLIEKNPTVSEYHRILGQILSDEGEQEEAINCLIDALRWDSKNGYALLMMGNIFAKFKNDVPTAIKYYDQALVANPKDYITISNIGAILMQQGKLEEAKNYLWQAIKINDKYPNTHFELGMIAEMEADLPSAFHSTIQAIKTSKNKDILYQNACRRAFEIAQKIIATDAGKKIFRAYRHLLETKGEVKIDIIQDDSIPTAAKIEFAENYDRDKHLVKFKANYPAVEHLVMHEMTHLDFVIDAQKANLNQLFTSTQQHKNQFVKTIVPTLQKLKSLGLPSATIDQFSEGLFTGLNSQIFNAPIDLLIENFLYYEYAELRPYQFISLHHLLQEGIKAVTDPKIVELSPKDIVSKSKVYNLTGALQFKDLFGLDFIRDYNASPAELKQANDFYTEYLDYKEDKKPAEEYEMILHWAQDLKLNQNFELVNEYEYRNKRTNIENLLTAIENDPFDLEAPNPLYEKETDKFLKTQEQNGLNMAIVMFMVDALQFFKNKAQTETKKIALEIAMQGTQGYDTQKTNYKISAIANKTFSGYHILAYYYVSWAIAIPEMLAQLQLPYEQEYEMALRMHNSGD
ncbi:tetratricopeptide repeat protein [Pedobacter alpinus]|uniref:Tetratricopeptide repeat protein n=1 Tax=Pedobacter alpinus TaxID=1590643 RepID=A0ABW5TRM7_9SPHI